MSHVIPMFSARRINSIEGYTRFFHVTAYLRQRSDLFPSPASDPALMAACGYRKAQKFARHRALWNALGRPVPLAYLEGIGARLEVLAVADEADMEEYRAALELPLFPKFGIKREIPGFYTNFAFPSGTSEAEAISIVLARARQTQHEFCINFHNLKAVFVYPCGTVSTTYFEPRLSIKGGFLVSGGDGRAIGTCRMG